MDGARWWPVTRMFSGAKRINDGLGTGFLSDTVTIAGGDEGGRGHGVELRDIEIFLAAAEELHFGRTAERLHVTPARVSQSFQRTERRLGAPLFDRTTRRVRLTALGQQLQPELGAARQG